MNLVAGGCGGKSLSSRNPFVCVSFCNGKHLSGQLTEQVSIKLCLKKKKNTGKKEGQTVYITEVYLLELLFIRSM